MFDVGLASPVKHFFTETYIRLERSDEVKYSSRTARTRNHAVRALIDSWGRASSPENIKSAAKATGIYPWDPDRVLGSRFVRELSTAEKAQRDLRALRRSRRLDINNRVITDEGEFNAIKMYLAQSSVDFLLLTLPSIYHYSQIIKKYVRKQGEIVDSELNRRDSLLTPVPPRLSPDMSKIIFFD
jgi:hypothetical protein